LRSQMLRVVGLSSPAVLSWSIERSLQVKSLMCVLVVAVCMSLVAGWPYRQKNCAAIPAGYWVAGITDSGDVVLGFGPATRANITPDASGGGVKENALD